MDDSQQHEQTEAISQILPRRYRVCETVIVTGGFAQTRTEQEVWHEITVNDGDPVPEGAVKLPDETEIETKDKENADDK